MLAMVGNATGTTLGLAGTGGGTNADSLALLKHGLGVKPTYYAKGQPAGLPPGLVDAGLTAEILGPPPKEAAAFMKLKDLQKGVGQYLQASEGGGGGTERFEPFTRPWQAAATDYPPSAFREWASRSGTAPDSQPVQTLMV